LPITASIPVRSTVVSFSTVSIVISPPPLVLLALWAGEGGSHAVRRHLTPSIVKPEP
jgi:hypothetical protein